MGGSAGTDDVGEWIMYRVLNPRASHMCTALYHRVECSLLYVQYCVYVCMAHSKRINDSNRFVNDEEKEMDIVVEYGGYLMCSVGQFI